MASFESDFATTPVPAYAKRGFISITAILVAAYINTVSIIVGMQLSQTTEPLTLIKGTLLGGAIVCSIASITAIIGAHTSLSTGMISTLTFGVIGKRIIAAILAITLFGWFGVQTEIFASSLSIMLEILFGISLPRFGLIIFGGALMSSTAIIGFKALEKLSFIAVPLLIFLIVWPFLFINITTVLNQTTHGTMSMYTIASTIIGGFIVGAVIMPDITRYARSKWDAATAAFIALFLVLIFMTCAGAFLGWYAQSDNFIGVMLSFGLGLPTLIIIILATWTTNDSNLYASSLNLAAIFQRTAKWKITAIAGILGTVLAISGITKFLIPWLILLGLFIAPAGGVIIGDFFTKKANYTAKNLKNSKLLRLPEIIFWLISISYGWAITPLESSGLGLNFSLTSIPPLDGFLMSFFLTVFANFVRKRYQTK